MACRIPPHPGGRTTGTHGKDRRRRRRALGPAFAAAALLALAATPARPAPAPAPSLFTFRPASVDELERVLDVAWQVEAARGTIPNLAPEGMPPGMDDLPVPVKKRVFFRSILPHVVAANHAILRERRYLLDALRAAGGGRLDPVHEACLVGTARRYGVEITDVADLDDESEARAELRRRVDAIPPGLVLAQAAIESGWGASRFARRGNNLFGQRAFGTGTGMVPRDRPEGARYTVAQFDHLGQSVAAYLHNLNTFWAYRGLRTVRSTLRRAGGRPGSLRLAEGLRRYSTRGEAYVEDVRAVIRHNDLDDFDRFRFADVTGEEWRALLAAGGLTPTLERGRLLAPPPGEETTALR